MKPQYFEFINFLFYPVHVYVCMYVCLTHTTHTHTHAHAYITHTHAYKLPTKVVLKNQASKAGIPGLKIITVAGGYCNCSGVKSCIF